MFSHRTAFSIRTLIGGMTLLSLIFWPVANTLDAQTLPNLSTNIILIPSTNSPIPNQKMTVKAESYVADLNSSTIIWTVNGKEVERGIGKTQIAIQAPASGKTLTISFGAVTLEGIHLRNTLVIGSGEVDLMVETDGYLPPFFRGKIAPVYQNEVKVVAIPHLIDAQGKEYTPNSLVYQWQKDLKALPSDSGYGKSSISVKGDIIPRPYTLTLTVASRDGRVQAEKFITITPDEPSILFYQDDPQYGTLYNKARPLNSNLGTIREVSFLATPYGFNKDQASDLTYAWSVNGASRPELSEKQSITLRAPADSSAIAAVRLQIRNKKEVLQGSNADFTTVFSTPTQTARAPF